VYMGRPAPAQFGSSDQMAACGFVGLYLKRDKHLKETKSTMHIDTDVLTERVVSRQCEASRPFKPTVPMEPRPSFLVKV
jgi:hypothetical protein